MIVVLALLPFAVRMLLWMLAVFDGVFLCVVLVLDLDIVHLCSVLSLSFCYQLAHFLVISIIYRFDGLLTCMFCICIG